ncbi:conserved hypothetical protein [Collimonas fungivorans Ter331]|uniref:Uncharacterized protein n=1 Tax=Collimonas fungivorans (strain Ter331) TaxID=1005048 RepID=G0AIC1_COLFT|nr:conserved hypothetical protein [Collimonas fungivorans Ter331]
MKSVPWGQLAAILKYCLFGIYPGRTWRPPKAALVFDSGRGLVAVFAIQIQCCKQATYRCGSHPHARRALVAGVFDQAGCNCRGKAAENRGRQAVGQGKAGGAHFNRHDFGQRHHHRAVVAGVQERQPQFDHQHLLEGRVGHQPRQGRIGGEDGQDGEHQQQRLAADAVGQGAHHRQPDEIRNADAEGHDQRVDGGQLEHALAESRRVDRDQVKRNGGHRHQHHAGHHQAPVVDHGAQDLAHGGFVLARHELLGFLQRAADHEQHRHDHAADKERDAPAPVSDLRRLQPHLQAEAEGRGDDDRYLLAGRLPADVKALVARGCHFRQVNRDAAQFDASRESLQQAADQHQQWRCIADAGVAGHEGDQHGAERHQRQGGDQALAAADPVDIGAEDDGAQRTHQKAGAESHEGQHQRSKFVAGREKGLGDVGCVEAEQEEIEHLHEVTAGNPQDCAEFRLAGLSCRHDVPLRNRRFASIAFSVLWRSPL